MLELYIGTSGWSYPHWRNVFYPPGLGQGKWLSFYAEHFRSVEVNMTFYRTPSNNVLRTWCERTPEQFVFTIKAPESITHYRKLENCMGKLDSLYRIMGLLEGRGRCILFQFPPSFICTGLRQEVLISFLEHIDARYDHAFEFRHPSWWSPDNISLFRGRGTFCSVRGLGLPNTTVVQGRCAYVRFHGRHYDTLYSHEELAVFAAELKADPGWSGVERLYIYFNNDAMGFAVQNAHELRRLMQ